MLPARALEAERYERILLPITVAPTSGAFGSIWTTDIWYRSDADSQVQVFPLIVSDGFPGPTCNRASSGGTFRSWPSAWAMVEVVADDDPDDCVGSQTWVRSGKSVVA